MSDLSDEVINDPLARNYASMNDHEVVADLHTQYRTKQGYVSHNRLLQWAAGGPRKKLEDNREHVAVAAPVLTALDMLQDGMTNFDTGDADNVALLDGLISANVLDPADKTSLMALGSYPCTRAEELELGAVRYFHVKEARA